MKLTDRRLYQARNLEDFAFRYWFRDEDNKTRRGAAREAVFYAAGSFISPDTSRIWGPDVSGRWDGLVNFKVTADYGAKFAISKAVDGTVPTPYFKENNQSAYDAGLLNGSYGWLYPDNRINCTLQAQAYHDLIKDAKLRLPPAVDFEWTKYAGIQANPNYSDLRKWLAPFVRISGVKPILYTAAGYVALFGSIPADILEMISGVWVASYGGTVPLLPKGITSWDVWQFSANGDALALAPGNQGKRELDLNYMTDAFYGRYAGGATPPPTGETMSQWYRVAYTKINIRDAAGAHPTDQSQTDIGNLLLNDRIEAEGAPVNGWLHIVRVLRAGNAVPVLLDGWCSAQYCVAVVPPTTPPAEVKPVELVVTLSDGSKWRATGFQKV